MKRHGHRSEEVVFDISTYELFNNQIAVEIYNQLHFDLVKQLKEKGADTLTHALFIELMKLSHRYPDLQAQLAKSDFQPSILQEKRRLIVTKPTVAITCDLPLAFDEGRCSIEFSNIMLRGLICKLSHLDILKALFRGLGTNPNWETRHFLQRDERGAIKANLGQTTVFLSEREAYELCNAVDEVCQRYKKIMIDAANTLETWDFELIPFDDEKGFELFSVQRWLWDLMREFSYEFDYNNGTTDWHMFESGGSGIRVSHKVEPDHALIFPKDRDRLLSTSNVDLLFVDSITYLYADDLECISAEPLFEEVGPHGIWTAKYTKTWLIQEFIPKVLTYYIGSQTNLREELLDKLPFNILNYKMQNTRLTTEQIEDIMKSAILDHHTQTRVPLADITEPKHFSLYIHEIQSLFHSYWLNIPASILRPYYEAFTNLALCADFSTIKSIGYIETKLSAIGRRRRSRQKRKEQYTNLSVYSHILNCLSQQVDRIYDIDYEDHVDADLLSRVFATIVKDGVFHAQQMQLNAAKKALVPLLEFCQFENYFIYPAIWRY